MEFLAIIAIAISLSMDAFAVSVVTGAAYRELHVRHTIRMASFYGGFQAFMPAVGYLAGLAFRKYIEGFDHWVEFGILTGIGLKMIYESFKIKKERKAMHPANWGLLLTLAVATSIDALAVGITLSLITNSITEAIIIIGAVTFLLLCAGVYIGKRFGHFFESWIEAAGGLVLIGLGIKIPLQHILA